MPIPPFAAPQLEWKFLEEGKRMKCSAKMKVAEDGLQRLTNLVWEDKATVECLQVSRWMVGNKKSQSWQ